MSINQHHVRLLNLPGRFIQDCEECGLDVGDYIWWTGDLLCTEAQLEDLVDRAEHYAGNSLDAAPPGLKAAARGLLNAIRKQRP